MAKRVKILVIDDYEPNARLLELVLSKAGVEFEAVLAQTGIEFKEALGRS